MKGGHFVTLSPSLLIVPERNSIPVESAFPMAHIPLELYLILFLLSV